MTRIPLRARLSRLRQRIILTVRWWFRLEIDDIREDQHKADIKLLYELNGKAQETIKTLTGVLGQMNSRLEFYEKNIPRMRQLLSQWQKEQERLKTMAKDDKQHLDDGILADIQSLRQRRAEGDRAL